ncbi:MAG: hypothetical protein AAFQ82_26795, partial [Myxococcota bacterium]
MPLPRVQPVLEAWRSQLAMRIKFESTGVLRNMAFWILMLLGMFNTVAALNFGLEVLYGTPTYPMTRVMIQTVAGAFGIVPLIITVYYASELVWRERAAKMSDVIDATPTPSW